MYRSKYFKIQEYVPESVFNARGQKAWELMDPRLLEMDDLIREAHGPCIINTWWNRGLIEKYGYRDQSGLRTADFYYTVRDYFNSYSAHKYAMASDKLLALHRTVESLDVVREDIKLNRKKYHAIKGMEEGTTWLHTDVRNRAKLVLFSP